MRAIDAANQERYRVIESARLAQPGQLDTEEWRRRLMVQDRTGDTWRALLAAREALQLARGIEEEYQAREWLALISCDAGRHQEELRQARRMVQLQPQNVGSLTALRRAARCNRLWKLDWEVTGQLEQHPRWKKGTRPMGPAD
jgi:hypothetical protein